MYYRNMSYLFLKQLNGIYSQQETIQCDQWCYFDHGNDRCPAMYDAADNANNAYMHRLKNLIEAIRQGKRKPGEGLTEPYIEEQGKSDMENKELIKQEKVCP